MKKIIVKADGGLNVIEKSIPKISLGDTVVVELQSPVLNDYSIRADFTLQKTVSYKRPFDFIDQDLWRYTIPNQVIAAVSAKNRSQTLPMFITAYEIINNTINENEGYTNKLGVYENLSDLQTAHPTATDEDYAIVDGVIFQWDEEWLDSGLKEKLVSQSTTNIDIPIDRFTENTQELVDATITDQVLEQLSINKSDILDLFSALDEAYVDASLDNATGILTLTKEDATTTTINLSNILTKVDVDLGDYTLADLVDESLVYIYENGTAKSATISDLRSVILQGVFGITIEKVEELPETGQGGIIYLVPLSETEEDQGFAEYIWLGSTEEWERLGTTDIKLVADAVDYNNTTSGLTADNVQAAIDELEDTKVEEAPADGNQYARQDGAWEMIDMPDIDISDMWEDSVEEPDGTGVSGDPYMINTEEELAWLAKQVNTIANWFEGKYVEINSHYFDLSGKKWTPIGHSADRDFAFDNSLSNVFKYNQDTVINGLTVDKGHTYSGFIGRASFNNTDTNLITLTNATVVSVNGVSSAIYCGRFDSAYSGSNNQNKIYIDNNSTLYAYDNSGSVGSVYGFVSRGWVFSSAYAKSFANVYAPTPTQTNNIGGLIGQAGSSTFNQNTGEIEFGGNLYCKHNSTLRVLGGVIGRHDTTGNFRHPEKILMTGNIYGENARIGGVVGVAANDTRYLEFRGKIFAKDAHVGGMVGLSGLNDKLEESIFDGEIHADNCEIGIGVFRARGPLKDIFLGGKVFSKNTTSLGGIIETGDANSMNNVIATTEINITESATANLGLITRELRDTDYSNIIMAGKWIIDDEIVQIPKYYELGTGGENATFDQVYYLENSLNGQNDSASTGLQRSVEELKDVVDTYTWDTAIWSDDVNRNGWMLPIPKTLLRYYLPLPDYLKTRWDNYILEILNTP